MGAAVFSVEYDLGYKVEVHEQDGKFCAYATQGPGWVRYTRWCKTANGATVAGERLIKSHMRRASKTGGV